MKRMKVAAAVLSLALVLAACGGEVSPASQESSPAAPAESEPASREEAVSQEEVSIQVEDPYALLGSCRWGEGYLALLEEPGEFNRILWRTYDQAGVQLTQGEIGWENSYPIRDLPRSPLTAGDGIVSFQVEMPADYSGVPLCRTFTIAIDDSKLEEVSRSLANGDRYNLVDWYPVARDGELLLEWSQEYNRADTSQSYLRLRQGWETGEPVFLDSDDRTLGGRIYSAVYGEEGPAPLSAAQISFDAQTLQAVIRTDFLLLEVNMADGTVRQEYQYTPASLQTVVDESPSGTRQIYAVGEYDVFEGAGGCTYVSVDPDGGIHHLYQGSQLDHLAFLGEDTIVADSLDALTFYDPDTGKAKETQPAFDFGTAQYGSSTGTAWIAVGMAVDEEGQRLLLAYRENTFNNIALERDGELISTFPLRLAVMDYQGSLLADLDVGMEIRAYGKFVLEQVEITVSGDTARIAWPGGGDNGAPLTAEVPLP